MGVLRDHHLFRTVRLDGAPVQHDYRYDSSDSTGSSHPDGPKCPLDTEDQSYVPTGRMLHVEDEVRARANWRATRSETVKGHRDYRFRLSLFQIFALEFDKYRGFIESKGHDVIFTPPENNEPEDEVDVTSCGHITIEEAFDYETFEEDVEVASLSLEDGGQSMMDELKEVNLGTIKELRPTFISAQLSYDDENEYVSLLKAYKDIFAWSYKEMPGLDPKVNKLIDAGFILEVKYPMWIANIVPVRKKNGQLRVCVNFRDLNNACPKYDFPLPIMEIMIVALVGHEALSFMDGLSRYNQIRMALDDALKVKSKKKCDHLKAMKLILDCLRKYQLRMNPLKCAFSVTSGKFLGFIVRHRGVKVDHSKIDAIQKMPSSKNLYELR
ncbi:uncharacterized protein E6C27_scaffold243G001600 [Cucumis melo var. makuwa]|uniref:Reverse transcriptase domain-containing protein n=1 Tax=Cucumis melo var. makuwa TaxID=1194695 RepID=A0A5A7TS20_CUCMM|nr:uncharacterized protein E6C27_scaffold243G001600 [Cucumis melo var. makuwa]